MSHDACLSSLTALGLTAPWDSRLGGVLWRHPQRLRLSPWGLAELTTPYPGAVSLRIPPSCSVDSLNSRRASSKRWNLWGQPSSRNPHCWLALNKPQLPEEAIGHVPVYSCVSCQKLLISQCFGAWSVFSRNDVVCGGEVAASSVTRIQLLGTSSVNPAKTGQLSGSVRVCVWGGAGLGDIGGISLLLPQEPRSVTNSLPSRQPSSQRLAVLSRLEKPRGRRKWEGGSRCGVGSFLPGSHKAASSSQLTPLYYWT